MTPHQASSQILFIAAIAGALAVVLGAFGAHALSGKIEPERLEIYKLGVTYQYYHALALIATGLWLRFATRPLPLLSWAGRCFFAGILLFSGSLYLLALRDLWQIDDFRFIYGPLTPIGGLFLVAAWVLLAVQALKKEQQAFDKET